MEALVKRLSIEDDPERLADVFLRQADTIMARDAVLTLSRHDLEFPSYRLTRSWRGDSQTSTVQSGEPQKVYSRGILGKLLYDGAPVIVNRLVVGADDPAYELLEGMHSLACAPAFFQGVAQEMVVLLRRGDVAFGNEDLETLLLDANLLSQAVGNLHLTRHLREANLLVQHEQEQIGRMQRHLLPLHLPHIDGLELSSSYATCHRAGGDYFDVLALPDEQWGIFLADVSGHGTPAAVVMAMIHTLLHSFPGPPGPPKRVFNQLNRHLLKVAPEGMFATAFYGIYDPVYRRLRFASAGHPEPRLRHSTGFIAAVDGTGGLPLGVLADDSWAENELCLNPGDALLLYTDGVTEATNPQGDAFGANRLDLALQSAPVRAGALVNHVERHYKTFCHGAAALDDRTLLAAVAVP
jgi:sigma-B regulation protein RsbU (phosphoserine phosphatase)